MSDVYHGIYVYNKLAHINHGLSCYSVINYVSEHQLPHIVDASHTTPTTHVDWGPILLKLTERDIIYVLSESRTYSGLRLRLLELNQTVPSRTTVTV